MTWNIRWNHTPRPGSQREYVTRLEDKEHTDRFLRVLSQRQDTEVVEIKEDGA